MAEPRLIYPSRLWELEIMQYRQECLGCDGSVSGAASLGKFHDATEWLVWLGKLSSEDTCPPDYVPSTTLILVDNSSHRILGTVDIRHRLDYYLRHFGGHIGYSIRPSERGKGFGTLQLKKAMEFAANNLNIYKTMVTCNESNEASRRTILSCGGLFEASEYDVSCHEMVQRYWLKYKRPFGV